jgi:hypothetical protein
MEAINQMIEIVSGVLLSLIGNVVLFAIIGAIIGIVLSVMFIRKAKKNGWMDRSNSFWTFLAKTSYVLMPLALVITGLLQGGIWGAHSTADGLIEESTRPVIEYATAYLPELQSFVNGYVLPEGSSEREIIERYNEVNGLDQGTFMNNFNTWVLTAGLSILPKVGDFADPIVRLKTINPLQLKSADFELIPLTMKGVVTMYMFPVYWMFLLPFLTYLGVVVAECILYHYFLKSLFQSELTYANYQMA